MASDGGEQHSHGGAVVVFFESWALSEHTQIIQVFPHFGGLEGPPASEDMG